MRAGQEVLYWAGGIAVLAAMAVEAWLSGSFVYGEGHASRPILAFVTVHLAAGAAYAVSVWSAAGGVPALSRRGILGVLGLALVTRAVFLFSSPILEDDFYRYQWDGATVLAGVNPYRYAPEQVRAAEPDAEDEALATLASLRRSSRAAGVTLERVNHPQYSTIYPPFSVGVFALAQWLSPWSLPCLRLVLLAFDLGTMLLVLSLLERLALPRALLAAYAWCPLVIKEVSSSAHGDAIPAFLVMATLAAALSGRPLLGAASLASAVMAKAYPLALVPIFFAWLARFGRRRLAAALLVFLAVSAAIGSGIGWPIPASHSGFLAYARDWRNNGGLFALSSALMGGGGARLFAAGAALAIVCRLSARVHRAREPAELARASFIAVLAVFCLSPSQFPWYYVWVVPFLCLFPNAPCVLLAALLSLYYVGFWIDYHVAGTVAYLAEPLRRGLLLVEHLPFFGLAAVWLLGLRRRRNDRSTRRVDG